MRKFLFRKIYVFIVVLLLLFGINSSTASSLWNLSYDSYSYTRISEWTSYDPAINIHDDNYTENIVYFYNITQGETSLIFRTNDWQNVLRFVHCETPECYEAVLNAFGYDNVTDTLELDLRYSDYEEILAFYIGGRNPYYGLYCTLPFDLLEFITMMNTWMGLYGCFLPVLSNMCNFTYNITQYELRYEEFSLEHKTSFRHNRKKLEGDSFEIEFKRNLHNESYSENKVILKMMNQGLLCYFEFRTKLFDEYHDKIYEIKDTTFSFSLNSGYEDFAVVTPFEVLIVSMIILSISYLYKKSSEKKRMY
ncbi:MAG: hypothetical protein GPJ50_09525 [Candidatus Heimdallarchaeota archaeon]|nr:hypothetical protein [Candidatus Heimdallarchaeota archaeon]